MRSRVLVVGLGGLGVPLLTQLAAAGVGALRLSDSDQVSASNLQRQWLYLPSDLGRQKAEVAAERLSALGPATSLEPRPALSADNAGELLAGCDLVFDCTDTPDSRLLVEDSCLQARQTWIWGAAQAYEGMVSTLVPPAGLRQIFGSLEAAGPACSVTGVFIPLLGMVASVMAAEGLRLLLGQPPQLRGRLWVYDAQSGESMTIALREPEPLRGAATPPSR